jgi:hypothetical protein
MLDRIKIVCRGVGRNGHRSMRYLTAFSLYSSGNLHHETHTVPHSPSFRPRQPSPPVSFTLRAWPDTRTAIQSKQHGSLPPAPSHLRSSRNFLQGIEITQPIIPAAAALLCSQRCTTCRSHPVRSTLPWKRLMAAARREKQSKVVRVCVV